MRKEDRTIFADTATRCPVCGCLAYLPVELEHCQVCEVQAQKERMRKAKLTRPRCKAGKEQRV